MAALRQLNLNPGILKGKPFHCISCNTGFTREGDLVRHLTPKIQCPVPGCLSFFRRDKNDDFRKHANKTHTGHDSDLLTTQFKDAGKIKPNPGQRLCPKKPGPIPLPMASYGQQPSEGLSSPVAMASSQEQFERSSMPSHWNYPYHEDTDFGNMDQPMDDYYDPPT